MSEHSREMSQGLTPDPWLEQNAPVREPQRQDRSIGGVVTAAERLSFGQEAEGRHWELGAGHSCKVGQRGGGRSWRQADPLGR